MLFSDIIGKPMKFAKISCRTVNKTIISDLRPVLMQDVCFMIRKPPVKFWQSGSPVRLHVRFFACTDDAIFSIIVASPVHGGGYTRDKFW